MSRVSFEGEDIATMSTLELVHLLEKCLCMAPECRSKIAREALENPTPDIYSQWSDVNIVTNFITSVRAVVVERVSCAPSVLKKYVKDNSIIQIKER